MKKGLTRRLTVMILSLALIFTMAVPGAAFGATSSKAPAAPKITSCTVDGNTVTIKWSKVKGATLYKVYKRTITKEWKYLKTVKKTAANKKKYSDTAKYKLKITKDGKKYKVYKKVSVKHYKLLKKTAKRTYKFKGKYNTKYTFTVKAYNGKKYSKYSGVKTVKTEKKPESGTEVWPPVDDDPDDWDKAEEKAFLDALSSMGETTQSVRIAALELYKKLAAEDIEKGTNTMISPVSFLAAMGMLENGAKGETLSEIETAFGTDIQNFNDWFVNWNGLASLKGKTLRLADSVWVKDDEKLVVLQDFQDKISELYKAQFYKEPFNMETTDKINSWVSENTDEMIKKVVDELSEDTVMALINATCFRGKWAEPFNEEATKKDQPFFTREDGTVDNADVMRSVEYKYFENDYVTGTFKQYRKGYKIMFILPKEGVKVKDALDNLKGDDLYKLEKSAENCTVHLTLPKFSFDYTAPDCIKSLGDMGINKVFDADLADLSDMAYYDIPGYNLYVSNIIHKTHIDLHEKGTDAAAVTAILIDKAGSAGPGEEIKEVTLDRPFIFVISDNVTSTPIFMGTVQSIG